MEKRRKTILLVVVLLMIVTSLSALLYRYPGNYELIFGAVGAIFGAIALYISAISLETTQKAQSDSRRSADATEKSTEIAQHAREDSKMSASIANEALQLALEEAKQQKERYRVENSSLIKLHKGEMYVPLTPPFAPQDAYFREDAYSKKDYGTFFLSNSRFGTASTIDLYLNFINAYEFDDFVFNTNEIEEPESLFDQHQLHSGIFPQYKIGVTYFEDQGFPGKIYIGGEDLTLKPGEKGRLVRRARKVATVKPRRVGTLTSNEVFLFDLPINYRTLAQQFFLERIMVRDEDAWITPNPRLRVRVEYTEEILEHMNDYEEARRVKEFEITCSDNVDLAREKSAKSGMRVGPIVLRCNFNTQVIYDRPLSAVIAEKSMEEDTNDGSAGRTEE